MMIRSRLFPVLCVPAVLAACQETPAERFQREADEYNAVCPQRVDEVTSLDSLAFDPATTAFVYYYSVWGAPDSVLARRIADEETRARHLQNLANTAGMGYYLDQEVGFRYRYYSRDSRQPLGSIDIAPGDYAPLRP